MGYRARGQIPPSAGPDREQLENACPDRIKHAEHCFWWWMSVRQPSSDAEDFPATFFVRADGGDSDEPL